MLLSFPLLSRSISNYIDILDSFFKKCVLIYFDSTLLIGLIFALLHMKNFENPSLPLELISLELYNFC